jgi:hypothetical protein
MATNRREAGPTAVDARTEDRSFADADTAGDGPVPGRVPDVVELASLCGGWL